MNFKNIIQELIDSGMTQVEIAQQCDCRQSSISDLFTGKSKTPSWKLGVALTDLHTKIKQAA